MGNQTIKENQHTPKKKKKKVERTEKEPGSSIPSSLLKMGKKGKSELVILLLYIIFIIYIYIYGVRYNKEKTWCAVGSSTLFCSTLITTTSKAKRKNPDSVFFFF